MHLLHNLTELLLILYLIVFTDDFFSKLKLLKSYFSLIGLVTLSISNFAYQEVRSI